MGNITGYSEKEEELFSLTPNGKWLETSKGKFFNIDNVLYVQKKICKKRGTARLVIKIRELECDYVSSDIDIEAANTFCDKLAGRKRKRRT